MTTPFVSSLTNAEAAALDWLHSHCMVSKLIAFKSIPEEHHAAIRALANLTSGRPHLLRWSSNMAFVEATVLSQCYLATWRANTRKGTS